MKLIALLLLLLTISSTRQACLAGCLKCDPNGNCVVPDLSAGYVLSSNAAVQATVTNCFVLNPDGTCASCNAGYFLDATTSKCVAVPSASLITNCRFYSTATSCSLCNAGFYLNNNACTAVTTAVANCAAYSSATVCAACASGYILSLDSTSCVSVSSVNNCSGYSYVTCANCAGGYHLNRNTYLANGLQVGTAAQNTTLALFARNLINKVGYVGAVSCASNTGTNCATFTVDTNVCTACNTGYFLDTTGVCNAFPAEPIPNCAVYTNASTCFSCSNGYTLSNNACTAVATANLVPNCATYDGTSSSVTCTACASNYYLSGSNTCTIRVASLNLANCATFTSNADTCATCATGYIISSDAQQCYAAISNCAQHTSVPKNSTIQCSTCNSTYLLVAASGNTQSTCVTVATPTNCATFSNGSTASSATCVTCVNGYYLSGSGATATCVQQPTITNCSTYANAAGQCTTCNPANSFLVTQATSCQNVTGTLIPSCIKYGSNLSTPTCTTCATGFFLSNSNTACTAITIANCAVATSNTVCTNCAAGYYLNYNSSGCIAPYATVAANCLTNNSGSNGNVAYNAQACSICNQNYFPISSSGQYLCFSTAETAQFSGTGAVFNSANSATLTACLKTTAALGCYQCDPASTTPYLQGTPATCVASCTSGKYNKYTLNATTFQIDQLNVCVTGTAGDNCLAYAPDLSNNGALICVACQTNYQAIVPVSGPTLLKYTNVNPAGVAASGAVALSTYFTGPFMKYPIVSCVNSASGNTIATQTYSAANLIANCAQYQLNSTDMTCAKCLPNFTGAITKISSTNYFSGCTTDTTVSYTPVLGNLDNKLNNIVNVYGCPTAANVPVIVYAGANATSDPSFANFVTYVAGTNGYDTAAVAPFDKNIACRSRTTGVGATSTTWGFVVAGAYTNYNNCGIVVVSSNMGVINAGNPYANFCGACAPGYNPTPDGTISWIATACTAIANCASNGTIFNGCSACNTGYVLNFASNNVDFTTCNQIPAASATNFTNCYAASVTAGVTKCRVCNTGFLINGDGICQAIVPANCAAGGFVVSQTGTLANLNWSMYIAGNAPGCNRCSSGYLAVLSSATNAPAVCVQGTYESTLVDNIPLASPNNTVYVQHCKYYVASTPTFTCSACASGFVLSGANTCLANTNLANCLSATSATVCATCLSNTFSLTQTGACVSGNLPNCATYNYNTPSSNGTNQVCVQCATGYYLNASGVCTLGNITNCSVYSNSAIRCTTCATGFYKVDNSANANTNLGDLCIPAASSNGCAAFTIDASGNYVCTTCTNNTTQALASVPANAASNVCISFSPVTNCATYNAGIITTAAFTCATCSSGYYLTARNTCAARTVINNCATYTANADTCQACATGYFLNNSGASCTNYPNGVYKCLTYTNATTCSACKPGFYLASNACVAVTTAITNCSTYSAANACSGCATGYFLSNNACVAVTAQNCLTYSAANTCASCSNGFILQATTSSQTNNGVTTSVTTTNCVAASNKPNCATIDYNSPNNCLSCNTGYYLNNGACSAATAISQCAVYASATTCSICNTGYALSVDALTCVSNANVTAYADANCVNSQLVATPACSRCGPGSYFVNGSCSGTCSVTGCLACSPSSNSKCFICNTNYHQDTTGNCVANVTPVVPTSANIFGALSALVLALVVLLK